MKTVVSKKDVWIVIPAYNEEKYIHSVLSAVHNISPQFIVVDDGSRDKTFQMAEKVCEHTLRHRINLGKGAALKTGCEYAFNTLKAKAVIFMDSDAQHDPQELSLFFEKLKNGEQIILGIREFGTQMPLIRIIGNRFASYVVQVLFGTYIPDIPSGYKALTKNAYAKLSWKASDYGVELEIAARIAKGKLSFTTVPIKTIYHDLDRGMTLLDAASMIWHMLLWRITL